LPDFLCFNKQKKVFFFEVKNWKKFKLNYWKVKQEAQFKIFKGLKNGFLIVRHDKFKSHDVLIFTSLLKKVYVGNLDDFLKGLK